MQAIRRKRTGIVRLALVAFLLVPWLLAGAATPANADAGLGTRVSCNSGVDYTGGAWGRACLYQDLTTKAFFGAEYEVHDIKADGKCAHVRLIWWHENGNGYYDPADDPHRYYVCGAGTYKFYPPTPQRNMSRYVQVWVQVYVDGGHARSYPVWF